MKKIIGGITAPKGFYANGKHIGIKRKRKDLAVVYSDSPCHCAGTYTKNIVKAAPVLWNKAITDEQQQVQAIVINSGIANAYTGKAGVLHNEAMAEATADQLSIDKKSVLVASTGVIGKMLPIECVCEGIKVVSQSLEPSNEAGNQAAKAIMTTDTYVKEIAVTFEIEGQTVTLGGMAKGSGMIHPNMATMLSFLTTDIHISKELLQKALSESVENTYNMISVDGDTSTNDMVLVIANGKSNHSIIETENEDYAKFKEAIDYVNTYLSKQIVKDGEGVTKFIEVQVMQAQTEQDAKAIAKSVINSNLVKTAFFGEDANWGRIICAMGYSGGVFEPSKVTLDYKSEGGSIRLIDSGEPIPFDEEKALHILKEKNLLVIIDLHDGDKQAVAWGCDLSYDYVKINGEYRT